MVFHSVVAALVSLVLAPIYDGIERKMRAAVHSRIGPPILQTWYDIIKLFTKEIVVPLGGTWCALATVLELIVLASSAVLLMFVAGIGLSPEGIFWVIVFTVLVSAASSLTILRSVSQNNVYSVVGGFREFSLVLSAEPFLIMSLFLLASGAGSQISRAVAVATAIVASYVVSGRVPYDIAEAEPELSAGVNIELSGPLLGLATVSTVFKKFVSASLTSLVLVSLAGLSGWSSLAATFLLTPATWIAQLILSVMLGRSRVDLAVKFLYTLLFTLSILTLLSYGLGL